MVTSRPLFTAVMRLSTMRPTGTLRRRRAMSSLIFTGAPEVRARIQIMPKFSTMMARMKLMSRTTPIRMSMKRLVGAFWARK